MASDFPFIQFFIRDWLSDPAVSMLTPAARGVWFDLICVMHEQGRSGELRGTTDLLARVARCSTAELAQALTEFQATGAADVTDRNGTVTVVNRRMKRESDRRKSANDRQKKRRAKKPKKKSRKCHNDVTPHNTEYRVQNTEKDNPPNPPEGGTSRREGILAALGVYLWAHLQSHGVRIPPEIEDDKLLAVLGEWLIERERDEGKPPSTGRVNRLMAKLKAWGVARSVEAIEHSITGGYKNIYEPKGSNNGGNDRASRVEAEAGKYAGSGERLEPER